MNKNEKAKKYVDTKELVLMSYSPEYIDDVMEDMSIAFIKGYEQAEKDIISLIQSRLNEIIGDASPKPILRVELQMLIKRITEEE